MTTPDVTDLRTDLTNPDEVSPQTENPTEQMIDPETGQMVEITKPGQLLKGKHHKDGEYFEPEVKAEVLPEEEEEVGRFVTEPEDIRRTEVITLKEEEVKVEELTRTGEVERSVEVREQIKTEVKSEVGEVNRIDLEVEEEGLVGKQNNQTGIEEDDDTSSVTTEAFDPSLVNMDLDLDLGESDNDSDTTIEWAPLVETIDLKPTEFSLSDNSPSLEELLGHSENDEELNLPKLRSTYVDMRNSKIEKTVNKKKKKKEND